MSLQSKVFLKKRGPLPSSASVGAPSFEYMCEVLYDQGGLVLDLNTSFSRCSAEKLSHYG